MNIERKYFLMGASSAAFAALAPAELRAATPTHVLDIQSTAWEVRPGLAQRITTAGGSYPGTPLRALQGTTIDVAVRNRTTSARAIHWHGLHVSPHVDGMPELGTPLAEPNTITVYRLPITVGGTRWYHSHHGADMLFGGLSGPLGIDRKDEPGRYDREIVLMLHEFAPSIPIEGSMQDQRGAGAATLAAPLENGMNGALKMSAMSPNLAMRDARYA